MDQFHHFRQFGDIPSGHIGDIVLLHIEFKLFGVRYDESCKVFHVLTDHDSLFNILRFTNASFDWNRLDILSTTEYDRVLRSTANGVLTLVGPDTDISRIDPTFTIYDGLGQFRSLIVACHHLSSTGMDNSLLPGRDRFALIIDDLDLCLRQGSHGSRHLMLDVSEPDHWGCFGKAISVEQCYAYSFEEVIDRCRKRSTPRDACSEIGSELLFDSLEDQHIS